MLVGICQLPLLLHAAPGWLAELSPAPPGAFAPLAPCVVNLRVSWQGMLSAGQVRIEFTAPGAHKPGAQVVRATAASRGPAALLFPYTSRFWSELDPVTFRPIFFESVETDQKETVTTTVRHLPTEVLSEESVKTLKSGVTQATRHRFGYAPVYDLFSAMLYIRSQALVVGDHFKLAIHPFDSPYLLDVKVLAREPHQGRSAIRLSIGMQKIDRDRLELLPYKKLKKDATLWLSDDAARLPLELRAAAFIGDVRATLIP